MLPFKDMPLRRKLTVIIMTASLLALLLVSAGFVTYEMVAYRKTMRADLLTLADIIGNQSTAALLYEDKDVAQEILASLKAKKHICSAALYKQGRLLSAYPAAAAAPERPPEWPQREGARFEGDHFDLFHEIRLRGEVLGTLYLRSDLKEMNERLQEYASIVVLMMLASAAITWVFSWFLQRIISRPVFHLAATAKEVSASKNYSVRATRHGNDELGQLIDGFNLMLDQIQQRDGALQEAHDKLEKRVEERTKDLRAEIAERQRAESAVKQQLMRTNLLNRITQIISERQGLESILNVVLRQLEEHFGLDFGAVGLLEPQTQKLTVSAVRMKNPLLSARLDLREGLEMEFGETGLGLCAQGQTVYLADAESGPPGLASRFAEAGLRCLVAVPLLVENKLFGVMLSARAKPSSFSSAESEFLRMLGEHVALAAHQAKLYAELESAYNELRRTQQAVMQQERLNALGQMASGVAHDIINALSPVVGFSDLLLKGEHGLSADGRRYLRLISTAGNDIAHIVARLREFYRKRDERVTTELLNLNELAQQVVDMTRPRWRDIPQSNGTTVEVRTEFDSALPEMAGIESELREALTNLVLNAVDALPNGGTISIRTRATASGLNQPPEAPPTHVLLEVSDTGTGMTEEIRKRCLEPFFSTKGKRGTGLGLAMVYGVVERHYGSIEIDSEPGRGTTFRLVFPLRAASEAAATGTGNTSVPEPRRILYIDDEPLLRELLMEMLQADGHKVQVSDGGEAGLEVFRSARAKGEPFDLVITDLGMPNLDGRQVAGLVKQESPTTPVIILTGWGALMKENSGQLAAADGVLSKPPRFRELREMLCRLPAPPARRARALNNSHTAFFRSNNPQPNQHEEGHPVKP
ncbi:MAG TPA: ATP-binding protein [Candidatus Acidoferrum sp.]|jgi:signal transduction histidine kinase/DNA-binding NarL/FixJ family response regulator/HAMP domain-containing protein|nr:ATP-binding protein [Candidatus Acidoferrum sp.]